MTPPPGPTPSPTDATNDADLLAGLIAAWKHACEDFVELIRPLSTAQAEQATELAGWDVQAVAAHIAHLEAVLTTGVEETIEVEPAEHLLNPMGFYTEQGVQARQGRSLDELADEIEEMVGQRHRELTASPPTDASAPAPRTPAGVEWSIETLLSNRVLDVWMHEQDIRFALDQPGGMDTAAATHTLGVLGRGMAKVLGKRVAPAAGTSVVLQLSDRPEVWAVVMGSDGRAQLVDATAVTPDATITVTAADFVRLAGGRAQPPHVEVRISGDEELGAAFTQAMAITP